MIKCKAVITEAGDLAVEAVDCKLNMVQVACARFVILEPHEAVFNKPRVKELVDKIENAFERDDSKAWRELKRELGAL